MWFRRLLRSALRARPVLAGVTLAGTLVLGSCSSAVSGRMGMIERLRNRGPIPLSDDNPFLAANLFLTKEMERRPDLAGFVNHRGKPASLAVEQHWLEEPTLELYYPKDGIWFSIEDAGEASYITGPFQIGSTRPEGMPTAMSESPNSDDSRARQPPTQLDSAVEERLRRAEAKLSGRGFTSTTSSKPSPVVARSRGMAETTPRGDIVHYVTYNGETLSMIARWYTLDQTNIGRLSRINNLSNPDLLQVGDQIVIPSYLVRNRVRMTESDLQSLLAEVAKMHGHSR